MLNMPLNPQPQLPLLLLLPQPQPQLLLLLLPQPLESLKLISRKIWVTTNRKREINFDDSECAKSAVFAILEALDFEL